MGKRFDPMSTAEAVRVVSRVNDALRDAMPYIDAHGRLRPSRAVQRSWRYRLAHAWRALRGESED